MIKEIKLPEKTVTSTEELVDVFNEHFINIGPNLAETIQNENDGSFQDFINKQDPEFTFQPVSIVKVYNLINNLSTSKATGIDKYQPRCSTLLLLQLHLVLLRFLTCQLILIVFPLTGRQQEFFLCLRMANGLC